jgi:hypothetical protein
MVVGDGLGRRFACVPLISFSFSLAKSGLLVPESP